MYLNNYVKILCLPLFLTLTACGENVTFSPEQGDEKRYWVYAHTTRDANSDPETMMVSQSLIHYRVDQVGAALKMHVTPEHLQIAMGYSGFSSVDLSRNNNIQQVFGAGFDVEFNAKSGQLTEFKASNEEQWQSFVDQGGQVLINGLQTSMNTPGFVQSIPAQEKSQVTLPHFKGKPVTLTVQTVTETSLYATLSSQNADVQTREKQVYGQLKINRESGWLEKMHLVMNIPVEINGDTRVTQFALAMHPEEEPVGSFSEILNSTYYDDELYWYDIQPLPDDINTTDTVTQEDILPYQRGMMYEYEEGFRIAYPTDLFQQQNVGRIAFRDARAYVDTQLIDLQLETPSDQQFFDEKMNATATVQPIGWNKSKELKDLEIITAYVDYYKFSVDLHTVPWKGGKTQTFQLGDITLVATLVAGTLNEYRLEYANTEHSRLALAVGGMQGKISFPPVKNGPQWMLPSAKQMIEFLGEPALTKRTIGLKLSDTPTEVTFVVNSQSEEVTFSREMAFWDREWYLSSAEMPPFSVSPSNDYLYLDTDIAIEPQDPAFDFNADQRVATESAQNAVMALPFPWESVCQFSIENAPEVGGGLLEWQPQSTTANDLPGGPLSIAPNTTAYQLMTTDGLRRYFYDLTITTNLVCKGKPSWDDMVLPPSPQPWLIDVSSVVGFDDQQSVKQFISHYRIYDKHGERLLPLDREGNDLMADNRPISEVLFNHFYLKMSGKIARIERFKIEGEALEKQFVIQFPPLPKG